jgi:hypothetical protein
MGSADAGDFNTAIGYSTLITNTTGDTNIAVGRSSLSGNKAGNENIGLGAAALFYNQNGSGNIAIGEHAGSFLIASPPPSNENPTNSMYIGNQTKAYAANPTNEIVIGHEARGNGSNTTSIGRTGITTDTYLAGELHPYSAIHLPNGGAIASLPALFPNPSTGMRVYIINGPSSAGYRDIVSSASTGTQKLPIFYDGNNWIYA